MCLEFDTTRADGIVTVMASGKLETVTYQIMETQVSANAGI